MPSLDAQFVCRALNARMSGSAPVEPFGGVGSDSRQVEPGSLFVALIGPRFDGHDFVAAALAAGAAGALVQNGFSLAESPEACLLTVKDTTKALGDLAGAWRMEHSALVAAVTGSNGKSTTKEMLASIMAQRHSVLKNRGNLNNHIGLPLTLLQMDDSHSACVVEMGMNASGEIARLTQIAAPEVGVVTNVGPAHLGPLGSMKAVAAAKAELFEGLSPASCAVINLDDPWLAPWARRLACRTITFGLAAKAQVRAEKITSQGQGQDFTLLLPGGESVAVRLPAPGRHNLMNALAAAAAAWALGQGAEAIAAGLAAFSPMPGRLTSRPGHKGCQVMDDTYNANPASVAAGLATLASLAGGRRPVLVLGDMKELGPTAPRLHHQAGQEAAANGCVLVLALGEMAPSVIQGAREGGLAPEASLAFSQMDDLLAALSERLTGDELVLVKGSRSMSMERVVAALTQGGEA